MSIQRNILENIWLINNIEFFTIEEVTMGREIPQSLLFNIKPTIAFIDEMRRKLGFAISITSSYRSEAYNASVGGSKDSLHTYFNALDCVPSSGSKIHLKKMHEYVSLNRTKGMGIGYYLTFVHVDTRGTLGKKSSTWGKKI